jgi:hypothetical protein
VIEEVSIVEIKQGPYQLKDDKIQIHSKIKKIELIK